jgi:hypothetical protein
MNAFPRITSAQSTQPFTCTPTREHRTITSQQHNRHNTISCNTQQVDYKHRLTFVLYLEHRNVWHNCQGLVSSNCVTVSSDQDGPKI